MRLWRFQAKQNCTTLGWGVYICDSVADIPPLDIPALMSLDHSLCVVASRISAQCNFAH